jgi:hypothetical protein
MTTEPVVKIAEAPGKCGITRVHHSTAYAKSGNAHNPTVTYRWHVTYAGRPVGTVATLAAAKELAAAFEQEPEW